MSAVLICLTFLVSARATSVSSLLASVDASPHFHYTQVHAIIIKDILPLCMEIGRLCSLDR